MMGELQLLDDIQNRLKEEVAVHEPLKDMAHSLTLTISKGRRFKQLLEMQGVTSFYFTLSAFSQKIRSSSYPTA